MVEGVTIRKIVVVKENWSTTRGQYERSLADNQTSLNKHYSSGMPVTIAEYCRDNIGARIHQAVCNNPIFCFKKLEHNTKTRDQYERSLVDFTK